MNWQFIFSVLGIVFLLCLVFITFFARKKLGWVGGVRLSILMFAMIAIVTLFGAWLTSLPESHPLFYNILLFTSLSISIGALVYTAWQWSKFFLIFREAGRIASSISHTNFELDWFVGIFMLVGSLWLFDINHPEISLMWMGFLFLNQGLHHIQYRQNGIVYKRRFIPWNIIVSLSWKTEKFKAMLHLHLNSSEVISLIMPDQIRKNILEFIKLKLPTQFEQANISDPLIPPTKPLTNQSTSLNS